MNAQFTQQQFQAAQSILASGKNVWLITDEDKVIDVYASRDKAKEAKLGRVVKFEGKFDDVEIIEKKAEVKQKAEKKVKEVKEKKISKRQLAIDILNESQDKTRGAIIKLYAEKLGMSSAMASTYYYTAKEAVEAQGTNA